MQYRPAGPSVDIKVISGELEEIHLPHFLCLGGSLSSLKNAVEVLHKQDSGVLIEKCELNRFHARLVNPSFSAIGLFYSFISRLFTGKLHADVQVYRSSILPLTFRTYLLPADAHLTELVEKQENSEGFRGFRLPKPRPVRPLQMNEFYALHTGCFKTDCSKTDCNSTIYPVELDLLDSHFVPNFSVVRVKEAGDFKMELLSSVDNQQVWQAEILGIECCNNQDNVNTSAGVPVSAVLHTANIQSPVEVSTTSTEEMPSGSSSITAHTGGVAVAPRLSGSSNPVQPASASSSITAQNSGIVVAPVFHINIDQTPPK
ncbi:NACHT, LRR and PYD domains-containing protein 1 homolog [Sardina pilchardus]|uniref:NACHT, LRR and PYD domains-containing protein 1 homolog n=1 Tax=Sardina pilchardus TaxID=27697 RepID=UPI002E0E1334